MKYLFFSLLLYFLCSCTDTPVPKMNTGFEGKVIPSFNLLLMDSLQQLNTNKIPTGKPIVFILVSPFCPFCRALTKDIIDNMKSMGDIQFYFISSFPLEEIKDYYKTFQLNRYQNITVGQDYTTYFQIYYKATGVPYVAIYGKEKKLKQAMMGRVSTDVIKDIALK